VNIKLLCSEPYTQVLFVVSVKRSLHFENYCKPTFVRVL